MIIIRTLFTYTYYILLNGTFIFLNHKNAHEEIFHAIVLIWSYG